MSITFKIQLQREISSKISALHYRRGMLEVALKGLADWQRDRDRDFNLKMDDVIINSRNPVVGVCVCVCVCSFVHLFFYKRIF